MLSQIEDFVNWVHRRNAQARTWRDYRSDLAQFAAVVGDCDPAKVTFREIDLFIARQCEKGFKPATVNRRLAAILAFYAFLADEDADLICPIIPRRHYLREPQRLPRPVQEEALWAFFTAIEAESAFRTLDRAMFLLMLRCGLRTGEVRRLLFGDIDWQARRVRKAMRWQFMKTPTSMPVFYIRWDCTVSKIVLPIVCSTELCAAEPKMAFYRLFF